MESKVILEEKLYNSLTNLILYQNNVLIRKIAQDYPQWNLRTLKKYIKDKPDKTKIPKSQHEPKAKKKIIKKQNKEDSDCESDSEVKIIKKKVVLKRRKGKKDTNGYDLVEYLGNKYYIDKKTNYVYQSISEKEDKEDLEVEFVGMLEGKKINFDAEASS